MKRRAAAVAALAAVVGLAAVGYFALMPGDPTPTTAGGPPTFADETASSGIQHVYDGDVATYAVGGGLAAFDCNADGRAELYFAGGSLPAALYRNDSQAGGALEFTRLSDPATDLVGVMGAYPIDIDGDGIVDLMVLRNGENVILKGRGACHFERANEQLAFHDPDAQTAAFSAKWDGNDRLPTLAIGHYLQPGTYDCADNAVFRPGADGAGYTEPLVLTPGYCALGMLFSDWDRSGRRDLRITNDRQYYVNGQDQLWQVTRGSAPRPYMADDGWVSLQVWGMGIASFDLTGSGFPDVYLTSQGDNKLQTLAAGPAQPRYRDLALRRGITAAQPFTGGDVRPSTAWHPEFQDVNNDGFVDLFVSKGNVSTMPEYANRDPSNLFLGQPDGTFKEAADQAGILSFARARGAALVDLTLDGRLDLVTLNYGEPVQIWRNVGGPNAGNWLGIRLVQAAPNRGAIGALIEVQLGSRTIRRELTIGGGHAGGQLGWTHFGLGGARSAQVRVIWPDGEVGAWQPMSANQFAVIER